MVLSSRDESNRYSTAFATNLENNIRSESILPSLNVNLYKEIDRVPLIHNAAATGRIRELDEQGTRLWNLTPKLKKESAASMELVCLGMILGSVLSGRLSLTTGSAHFCLPAPGQSTKLHNRFCVQSGARSVR